MLIPLKFYKVLGLPSEPAANAVYFVLDEENELADAWVTDADGVPFAWGGFAFVLALLTWANIADKPESFPPEVHDHDDLYYSESEIDTALESKADLVGGKVPAGQLPSYVDDVIEAVNFAALPGAGETGKIYTTLDDNLTYRWTGTVYVEISASLALGETSGTAYRGDRGKTAYDHTALTDNPHGVTKAQVGLGSADNTADINKPVSAAQQAALDLKADKSPGPRSITTAADTITQADNGKIIRANRATAQILTATGPFSASFNCLVIQVNDGLTSWAAGAGGATVNQRELKFDSAGKWAQMTLVAEAADSLVLGGDLA